MINQEDIKQKFLTLVQIMEQLRSQSGCPWDREQTYESLRQYLLEETYEVLELIDEGRYDELKNELGDLMLQVIFQSQIAAEEKRFTIADVLDNINKKLIHRHPNVFGNVEIRSAEEQTVNWEKMKKKEDVDRSVIAGVPRELPALLRAHRMQAKAATVGFDWPDEKPVWEKLDEEIRELNQAIAQNNQKEIEEEFGDLLFTVVNLSRFLKVNPEASLRKAVDKFSVRFQQLEKKVKQENRSLSEMTLDEMDEIWDQIKANSK